MRHVAIAALLLLSSCAEPSFARDSGQWGATPNEVSTWYRRLMEPDFPTIPCCGDADAYYADSFEVEGDHYVAIITDERTVPNRPPIPIGTRIRVPNHKLKYDDGNPTGHGVIFVQWRNGNQDPDGWHVLCYVVPGGV